MRHIVILLLALSFALLPATAFADSEENGGFILRVNGDATLAAADQLDSLVVINGDATVDGTIHESLTVVNGDAVVSGSVLGDINVVRGDLRLLDGASVNNVNLVRGDLEQAPGAMVNGEIERTSRFFVQAGWATFLGVLFFVGLGLALLAVAIGFALLGAGQLKSATTSLAEKTGQTILAGIVTVIVLPIVAGIAIVTIVGAWIGLGILFVLIPALTLLGLAISATWIGSMVLHRNSEWPARPVGAAALGTLIVLVALAVPGVNALAVIVLGTWGVGGLVYTALRGMRQNTATTTAGASSPAV